jgi:hypothetical protein
LKLSVRRQDVEVRGVNKDAHVVIHGHGLDKVWSKKVDQCKSNSKASHIGGITIKAVLMAFSVPSMAVTGYILRTSLSKRQ